MKLVTLEEFQKLQLATILAGHYVVDLRVWSPTVIRAEDIAATSVSSDEIIAARIDRQTERDRPRP